MSEQKQTKQAPQTTQLATRRYDPLAPIGTAGGLKELLQSSSSSLAISLPRHITPERLIKTMLVAVNRTPDLLQCTQSSIMETINRAAELGLDLSGTLGEAYPVPFNNKIKIDGRETWVKQCTLIIGYRGMEKLAWQTGEISSIDAEVVRENDTFVFKKGSAVLVEWSPCLTGDPGRPIGAYCCVALKSGGRLARFMPVDDIERIRSSAKSKDSPAWVNHWGEMARKCVIKRTLKDAPLSTEKFSRAMEYDSEDMEGQDVMSVESSAGGAEELRAKFAAAKQIDNTPTTAAKDRPQPSTAETGMNAGVASPGSTSPVRPDSEAAPGTEAEEDAPIQETQEAPVKDVAGQLPIFPDAPLPDVPNRERKKAAAATPPAVSPAPPTADADSPLSEGMYTGPVDPSVFPQGPKDEPATVAPSSPDRKTWTQFCDECSTLADNVCVSTGFVPERMSTQLTAALKSIYGAKGFADDDATRETILTAIEEQRGKFAFLAPPPAVTEPARETTVPAAAATTTAAPASEPPPADWQTFAAAYGGLSSIAGNDAAVTEAGLKKIALRKGWLGAKSAEAATPTGQKFMGEILAAVRSGKWDWANAKPVK